MRLLSGSDTIQNGAAAFLGRSRRQEDPDNVNVKSVIPGGIPGETGPAETWVDHVDSDARLLLRVQACEPMYNRDLH